MARPLRLEFPGALYHITSRGNERKDVYCEEQDYKLFLEILAQVIEETNWLLHSYCLMPNHYHLLVETPEPNLSKGMRQLNGIFTQRFNYRHKRNGYLLQGRYKAIIIEKEAHLLELCRYIVLNPVRAKITQTSEDWLFSSYLSTIGRVKTQSFLYTDFILSQFAKSKRRAKISYQRFVAAGINKVSPLADVVGQIYLGSQVFRAKLEKSLKDKVIDSEIPIVQRYPIRPKMTEILQNTAKAYQVKINHLLSPRKSSKAREVAAYLCRQLGGYDLSAIAEQFGVGYTQVSRLVSKVRDQMKLDKSFKKQVGLIETRIKNSKVKT